MLTSQWIVARTIWESCIVSTYYFMAQGLVPDQVSASVEAGPFRLVPRRWGVGIWDWALLSIEHNLKVPYQFADLAAREVNLEFAVEANDVSEAVRLVRALRLFLAANYVAPMSTPTISTHSINDFSEIKQSAGDQTDPRHARASALASGKETVWLAGVRGGRVVISPDDAKRSVDFATLSAAARAAEVWVGLLAETPRLRVVEDAALTAPEIANLGQGILQMWTGLEALFPTIHAELSFRLALYLAQLDSTDRVRRFKQAKDAYKVRSKVAHGHDLSEPTDANRQAWSACWSILHSTAQAIVDRGELPSAEDLEAELLA